MMGGYGMGYGWGLLGILYMVVPLLLLGLVIYWAVRTGMQQVSPSQQKPHQRPLEIAEERYARGEISHDQLEEIRRNLKQE